MKERIADYHITKDQFDDIHATVRNKPSTHSTVREILHYLMQSNADFLRPCSQLMNVGDYIKPLVNNYSSLSYAYMFRLQPCWCISLGFAFTT